MTAWILFTVFMLPCYFVGNFGGEASNIGCPLLIMVLIVLPIFLLSPSVAAE